MSLSELRMPLRSSKTDFIFIVIGKKNNILLFKVTNFRDINLLTKFVAACKLASSLFCESFTTLFSQPSIYIDGWLWHEDDVCRL